MLGILKAGGAFVALDPLQSAERLEEMARVLGCTVVVTSDVHLSKILSLPVQALVLPRDLEIAKGGGCSDPVEVTSTDAALVLFTSGSTGQPKAMIHEHGSICSHAVALGEAMGYRGRRVLQFSAYIWDVAVMDIFITLIFGGCVCIPSEEDRVGNIAAFIRWSKADLALLTPSYSRSIDPQSVPSLKTLALAGECMTQEDVRRWGNHVTLMNAYGPAEVGVCSLNAATAQPENIGRGLPNSPCWVVNPNDVSQLVPLGAVGELVVAGPDLAREYLNQPELTANSFVVDPLWAVRLGLENRRFYRTGDLVCYDLNAFDGSMLFMGRKDDQIKVRGQRIEPGEIEYHLCQVPRVKHAVVTMPRRGFWKDELVAVVETSSYGGITSERGQLQALPADSFPLTLIQDHLAKFLPSFMVPTACVVLSYLPLTASMKINRKEVKTWLERSENKPKDADGEPMRPSEAVPLDKNEKTAWSISALIEKYLNTLNPDHPVALSGYDFSLQEAGLNSIQTITLFSMLRKLFGESVSLPAVMQTRLTVRNLARLIDRPKELSSYTVISPINLEAESRNISHQLLESLHCQMIVPQMKKSVVIRNVFLTGASGYLGREILRQLLAQQGVHVYVHMRSSGEKRFNDSIKQTATAEGWWNETFRNSYTVWPGDLTKRGLGLSRSHLDLLHGRGPATKVVNAVIHCGAVVHYAHDYETLRQPNVVSTMTLLEATARSKHLCSFVFISGGRNPNQQGKLDQPGQADKVLWNGYSQSKYVSDRVIRACNLEPAFDGKRICSVSPGYIIGSASNGRANTRDFIWRLIAGCIEIGAYNQDEADRWLFVFDVEGVSEAAVNALLKRGTSTDKDGVAPILEGVYFQTIWDILRVECGYSLHGIPGDRWLSKLKNAIFRTGETHPLFPLLPTLEINGQRLGEAGATFEPTLLVIECLRANIRYLIRTGFLPKPPSLAKGAVS
ncbi:hypothetical protein BJY04DRAFT_231203 [Aspergillus karnatakaensis]|uniref:nonribosomal peptide synthetase-like enzyme fsqF n=1 Tax=Aspergillus karnatakaensis TaxID=1810916 RepID=UPI003CCD357B